MKISSPIEDIRYDMSQFYPLKDVLNGLFGKATYNRLKETADLRDWKAETKRLLKAIEIAIIATVRVADQPWHDEVRNVLKLGRKHVAGSKSITALFAHLSATLTRLVFIQIGFLPKGGRWANVVPLAPKYWKLDPVRTVQYVQSASQCKTAERLRERLEASRKNVSIEEQT